MADISVFSTRPFAQSFRNALAEGPSAITIVSPYLTPIRPWANLLGFVKYVVSRGTERVEIVTCPPVSNAAVGFQNNINHAEAELIAAQGVSLKIRESSLHAKLFYFEFDSPRRYTAFIGSSNFTQGGFERNDETMVRINHPLHESTVNKELKRLTGYGSFPYHDWRASKLTAKKGL